MTSKHVGSNRGKAKAKKAKARTTKHAATYRAWRNMLARCFNTSHVSFRDYGGRGISVSALFVPGASIHPSGGEGRGASVDIKIDARRAFKNFVAYVGLRPSKEHSLDRYPDVNGHYVPGNIRWALPHEQGSNKRGTKYVVHPTTGLRVPAATLARELGVHYHQLRAKMIKEGTWNDVSST